MAEIIEDKLSLPSGKIWYRLVGDGPEVPMVVLHGGPGMPHQYMKPFEVFSDKRKVLFYDQLDCGRSDRPGNPDNWNIGYFLEELTALLAHLDFRNVHLASHSWGTILAIQAALADSIDVASIIMISPCLNVPRVTEDMKTLKAGLPKAIQEIYTRHEQAGTTASTEYRIASMTYYEHHMCRIIPFPKPLQDAFDLFGEAIYRHMWGNAEICVTGTLKDYACPQDLARLKMPVLLLCGRYDETTPEATAEYHAAISGSEMFIFETSAHFLHLEETERFLEIARAFVDRTENPAPTDRK